VDFDFAQGDLENLLSLEGSKRVRALGTEGFECVEARIILGDIGFGCIVVLLR
jgi:hypothetical protein